MSLISLIGILKLLLHELTLLHLIPLVFSDDLIFQLRFILDPFKLQFFVVFLKFN